ncbi:hypothetical protein ACIP5T_02985 [Microbacterium sp. NPDC088619]|uniref:hypothetical protein n=1 Tax=Microbacterium sp. NPDC088619 TaxID=3364196 RepID=UPI0037F86868
MTEPSPQADDAEAVIDRIWQALDSSDNPNICVMRACRVLTEHFAQRRVGEQVARNAERLEASHSGATEKSRRDLAQREQFLHERALGKHG